jgi:bacillithiol system protein YtxJ
MGFFNAFKKNNVDNDSEKIAIPWNQLITIAQIQEIKEISKTTPVAIFKHSTRCGISRMVLRNFEKTYAIENSKIKMYYLDLLAYRTISDEVGYEFQVLHQSPQLLVIKNGVAVAQASHHSIETSILEKYL